MSQPQRFACANTMCQGYAEKPDSLCWVCSAIEAEAKGLNLKLDSATKVWIVCTEWNRPHDVDGAACINGAALTKEGAEAIAKRTTKELRGYGHKRFAQHGADDDSHWDFDILIEEHEVEP